MPPMKSIIAFEKYGIPTRAMTSQIGCVVHGTTRCVLDNESCCLSGNGRSHLVVRTPGTEGVHDGGVQNRTVELAEGVLNRCEDQSIPAASQTSQPSFNNRARRELVGISVRMSPCASQATMVARGLRQILRPSQSLRDRPRSRLTLVLANPRSRSGTPTRRRGRRDDVTLPSPPPLTPTLARAFVPGRCRRSRRHEEAFSEPQSLLQKPGWAKRSGSGAPPRHLKYWAADPAFTLVAGW